MKNNFKFLIVLAILLAGCICIGSTFAAESNMDVTNVGVADTQYMHIAHDDSSNDIVPNTITPELSISPNDSSITYGDLVTISGDFEVGHEEVRVTGTVFLYDNNTIIANKTINNAIDVKFNNLKLAAGTHGFKLVFISSDEIYGNTSSTVINPTVDKATPYANIDIIPENITYGDDVTVIVTLPDDATGIIEYSLDNDTWIPINIPEDASSVEFDIPDLDAGNYILFVKYSGDGNYNPVYSENPFTVDQLKTIVTVDSVKGKVGEKVKITARVTDERGNPVQEGTVTFRCMNLEFKAEVVDGIATIVTVLPNATGTYNADAFYEGSNYESSSATFTVEVSDIPGPNPDPNPKNDVNNPVGNMENTGNPLLVLLIALAAIGLESFRRKF